MTANVNEEAEAGNPAPDQEPGPGAGSEPRIPPQAHAGPEPQTGSEPKSGSEPGSRAEAADHARPEAEPGNGTAAGARPGPDPEPDADRGKAKKARKAVRGKSAGATKTLVVWREGKVQYADDGVLVVDLDEACSPDTDVHDVVDRLTELREALDSPGRADAVAALAEIIQDKALS